MGLFKAEIVPVTTTITDDKGNEKTITVHQDEGIRPSTTLEALAKLKPAFKKNGTTTAGKASQYIESFLIKDLVVGNVSCSPSPFAVLVTRFDQAEVMILVTFLTGNSSQVSDGAAAILLAKRSKAAELGLPVLGVLKSFAVVGVPPEVMGIGPAYAIPIALEKAGKELWDLFCFVQCSTVGGSRSCGHRNKVYSFRCRVCGVQSAVGILTGHLEPSKKPRLALF